MTKLFQKTKDYHFINHRKPPIPKDKPKVPVRPDKLLNGKFPIAAPRNNSFTYEKSESKCQNEVTISDESVIDVSQNE